MCLAIPTKVIEILKAKRAIVSLGGIQKEIALDCIDDVQVGDYVIVHVGYALAKLDAHEAEKTLNLLAQLTVEDKT